jgi:hypothetical protein
VRGLEVASIAAPANLDAQALASLIEAAGGCFCLYGLSVGEGWFASAIGIDSPTLSLLALIAPTQKISLN